MEQVLPKQGNVAVYARISKRNYDNGWNSKDTSIVNQIQLAQDYISKDWELSNMKIQIFKDEGYTGTNMDRPAVQRLLAGICLGKIQALVIKDFSRLSRNHLQLSEFRECMIKKHPIVLVSIGDHYDSRNREEMSLCLGMKSIFYEYYCRDISKKVKQSISTRKKNGEYAVAKAPFGYRRGKDGRFVIDKKESETIRYMFEMAEKGWNSSEIARQLSDYGMKLSCGKKWYPSEVWRVIHNPVYMGCQVWHKYENRFENGFTSKEIPSEAWEIREGMHPEIISGRQFYAVQKLQSATKGRGQKKGRRHLFRGITKCGVCNNALCRHRQYKERLCCRIKHGEALVSIDQNRLWKICLDAWERENNGKRGRDIQSREEKRLFLQHFIKRIEVEEKKISIVWKTRKQSDIIKTYTNE